MASSDAAYICPMHPAVRQATPGTCPTCGMALVPERARFRLLRHMVGSPLHLFVMIAAMLVLMALAMLLMR